MSSFLESPHVLEGGDMKKRLNGGLVLLWFIFMGQFYTNASATVEGDSHFFNIDIMILLFLLILLVILA